MRGDRRNLQNDSSSGSSSPHSNTSHEEPLDDGSSDILQQKVVYNFSIPEFINHDREERSRLETTRRKRKIRSQRLQQQESQEREEILVDSPPVIIQRTKRRRRANFAGVASFVEAEEDRDDDCHRRNVPVIDLTGIDSHDDADVEHRNSQDDRSSIYRPFRPRDRSHYANILSDLENDARRERHERLSRLYFRSPSLQRLHRIQQLRRRNEAFRQSSRQIITDGPRFTEDMLIRAPESGNSETTGTGADDSVLIVNEVRGDTPDRDVAERMQNDPTYPTPYFNGQNSPDPRLSGDNFQLIEEQLRSLSSAHVVAMQHMRQLTRDRNPNPPQNADEQHNRSQTNESDHDIQQPNDDSNSREDDSTARTTTTSDDTRQDDNDGNGEGGEVEFIGEWNSNLHNYMNSRQARQRAFHRELAPLSLNTPYPYPFSDIPVGSHHFMRLLSTPPRLHHLYQESYEALLNLADTLGPGKPRGLEKSEIERIPSFRFSSNTAKGTNAKCVVCISEYSNREKLRRLPCSHDFHAKCIDKWLKANKTCPVCRDEVKVTLTE